MANDQSPGLDEVRDALYAVPPEEFTARRTSSAQQARKDGDRALATAIVALRRPTRSAWLVNLLAREATDDLGELLDLGAALAQAQRDAAGAELRTLSAQRSAAVGALVRTAVALGAERGHQATEPTRQEVIQTLTAALADPGLAEAVRGGWVTQAVSYGGFGPDLVLGAPESTGATVTDLASRRKKRGASPEDRLAQLTEQAEQAMAALDRARTEVEEAHAADDTAREALSIADQKVDQARKALVEAEKVSDRAAREHTRTMQRITRAERALADAEQVATRAAQELRSAT